MVHPFSLLFLFGSNCCTIVFVRNSLLKFVILVRGKSPIEDFTFFLLLWVLMKIYFSSCCEPGLSSWFRADVAGGTAISLWFISTVPGFHHAAGKNPGTYFSG